MKTFFTLTAVTALTVLLAIIVAGNISNSNKNARSQFERKLETEVIRMTETMEKAAEEIERLTAENETLKAAQEQPKKTAAKPATTVTTKPATTKPQPSTGTLLNASLVSKHASESDCWIIVSGKVYSVSSYIAMHPGGKSTIVNNCGKDATTVFTNRGNTGKHSSSAYTMLGTYLVGTLGSTVKL